MRILVIGNGGREHAIAWKLAQSPQVTHVYVAPGNAGTHREPKVENVNIAPTDFEQLVNFAKEKAIAFTVVGPEAPLVAGVVDYFNAQGLLCLGPTQKSRTIGRLKGICQKFYE